MLTTIKHIFYCLTLVLLCIWCLILDKEVDRLTTKIDDLYIVNTFDDEGFHNLVRNQFIELEVEHARFACNDYALMTNESDSYALAERKRIDERYQCDMLIRTEMSQPATNVSERGKGKAME